MAGSYHPQSHSPVRLIPRTFESVSVEKDLERDTLKVRCLRTGLIRMVTSIEILEAASLPPPTMEKLSGWIQKNFLSGIYVARKR